MFPSALPSAPSIQRRSTCARCLRAQTACICSHIVSLQSKVEVLILQHPLEVSQTKGSARLLHMSLAGSQLETGEAFAPEQLQQWLHAGGKQPVLLYPASPHSGPDASSTASGADQTAPWLPQNLRLIVLDGTWRKSRKMLHANPQLALLPRYSLSSMPASHYRVRKAHRPDQLSTLEAVCYALAQLEGDSDKYAPLLEAFDRFVAQLARYWQHD